MSEQIFVFQRKDVPEGCSTISITNLYEGGVAHTGFELVCISCNKKIHTPKLITQHGRIICPYCHMDL